MVSGNRTTPTVDARSFVAMAKAKPPLISWVREFYEKITSLKSPLRAFLSGDVRDIKCCKDSGGSHYLLICVHIQNKGVPIVWLRTEKQFNVSGTIQFSTDRSRLGQPYDDDIMATTFSTLDFRHVADLLNNVSATRIGSLSYASVVSGMLHGCFGGSWIEWPRSNWLKNTFDFLARDAADIETVQGKFAFQYPNAKMISLMDRETWKNKDYSLSQPPSSKQDDRKGVDSNLAGPRPMPSSNANTVVPAVAPDAEKNGGDQARGREINRSDVLTPKPVESPKPSNFHRRVMSQIRDFFNADKNGGDQARGREINRS
ncbi:hypothetical protein BS47DRAFT_1490454, partial [Hydnum rufescens UP504]